jgi:polyisoprenyl-teichoic acid--peptidoglycan teichoic acid transferase
MKRDRPPRPGRGVLWRALIAAVLTIGLSATAVASAVLLDVHRVTGEFTAGGRTVVDIPEIDESEAGGARTFLILGSDARYSDKKLGLKPRSDTLMVVRVDPQSKRIAVMSLPRDLKVKIPGVGTGKINEAYADGGPRKTVATVKKLFRDATNVNFPINGVVNVNFNGFQRAVNYVGGVYVDIDRRYYNDNTTAGPGENYATIDVQPGYQKLVGSDALDYVRYRHGDSDLFRASRQQDFLRQISHQGGVRKLLDFGKRDELAHIFGRYFEVDKSFVKASNLIGLAKTGLYMIGQKAPVNEVRFPATDSENPAVDTYLYVTSAGIRKAYDEFMTGKGSTNPKATESKPDTQFRKAKRKRNKPSSISGLEQTTTEGENMAVLADPKLNFPFYYPTLRKTGSRYSSTEPRLYDIKDEQSHKHQAYRLTLYAGAYGEYYGVQGMSWRDPPILDDPDGTRKVAGRKLQLYYDGSHLRLVAWRTPKAVYWVTNTLSLSIPNSRLIAIAGSLRRLNQ